MTDHELAAMSIEDRNRILDAYLADLRTDIEYLAELGYEYGDLLDDGPLPGYDAFDMEFNR